MYTFHVQQETSPCPLAFLATDVATREKEVMSRVAVNLLDACKEYGEEGYALSDPALPTEVLPDRLACA